jgi:alpha-N-arabinofuranosidase
MTYRNPVISGFHPDPSICRVGQEFYLVNSSFEYFPGIPIWHSRDLVHWQQIGNVLTRRSQLNLGSCACSDGIYAPTIRHHDGTFYVIVTLVVSEIYRNFYVTAMDAAGPWSDPIWYDQSGIDPSLFFDDNGRVYFQSNRGMTFRTERAIYQSEIDIRSGRRLSEPRVLWRGSGGSYVEGPHVYKRNGWYYLLAAEGGTSYGHMVTIARSRNVWGEYEGCPRNPILSNRYAYEAIHGTGHGDLVEAANGAWWMVHLAFRKTVGDIHTLGRETYLAPVTWDDEGWPVVNGRGTVSETMEGPTPVPSPWPEAPARDDFDGAALGAEWIHLRNPEEDCFSLSERKGVLRLKGGPATLFDLASPTFVGRRQEHFELEVGTLVDFDPPREDDQAGITLLMTNQHHYDFFVTQRGGKRVLRVEYHLELIHHAAAEIVLPPGPVELRIGGTRAQYSFAYAAGGGQLKTVARVNTRYLGTEVTGGYNGVVIGLYATGGGQHSMRPADFDWFEYRPQ